MLKLGQWLFNLACRLNPAIPLAMSLVAEQRAQELAAQALAQLDHVQQHADATLALALHQQEAAARAARQ